MLQPASSKDTSAGTSTRYMTLLSRRIHTRGSPQRMTPNPLTAR